MKISYINEKGIAEIAEFLRTYHKKGESISTSPYRLKAWAADAEFQLGEGNSARIEISHLDSVDGTTCTYEISDEGISFEEIEE